MPNSDTDGRVIMQMIEEFCKKRKNAKCYKSLGQINYLSCLKYVDGVVGNSSSGIREGAYIGTPVVNIGSRQNGRERGKNVIQVNYKANNIYNALRKQVNKNSRYKQSNIYYFGG